MKSEDILFEFKPCSECVNEGCLEGHSNAKCPYDKMAEDLIYAEEWEYIQSQINQEYDEQN
jgi:hypothetical protein